jgi:hypothetical protein
LYALCAGFSPAKVELTRTFDKVLGAQESFAAEAEKYRK